jgi:hypothetical protein
VADSCHFAEHLRTRKDALDDACDEEGTVRALSGARLAHTREEVGHRLLIYDPILAVIFVILFDVVAGSAEEPLPDLLVNKVKHVYDSSLPLACC